VTLVEKTDKLGGWAAKYKKVFPKNPPYEQLEDSDYQKLISDVESHENITVHKSTVVKKTNGQPGQFDVTLEGNGTKTEMRVGSFVLATGWKPYDPKKLTHLGYGTTPDIVTNIQMEEMVNNGGIKRPSDGKPIDSIAFIQCAGSRDQDHLPYCSAVCCRVSLKQAMYVREQYPDAKIYIIYKDLRSPQQFELFYANAQNDDGLFMTKGEIENVAQVGDKVEIEVSETLLGEDIKVQADMVVLATGMVPTAKVEDIEEDAVSGEDEGAESKEDGKLEDGKKAAEAAEPGAKLINLSYRQGTDLPTLKYGFPDSHFICFPYETRRTAIYAAGGVRAPMDLASSANDAYGAALKAIQAVEATSRGEGVHPRAGDLSYPELFLQRCTQCKRCTEECPFGTYDEDEKGTPLQNPLRCRRCGICLGACPERIISFKNYSIKMMSAMIKSIEVPDEFEEKPRILVFVCENDAMPAVDMAGMRRLQYNSMVRIIPLRCIGSMNVIWIGDALARGFDGVILLGCKKGDDYQCHFVRGSELATTRMDNVREKLKQLVLEEERVQIHEVAISDYNKIPKIMDDFLEVIDEVGPNPYKGM
jgi:quinone-modifying oxidoreductase subunit QmoB